MNATWTFDRLSDARARLGESPVWSARENAVWWVDVTGRKLLRSDAGSGKTLVWTTPEEIGFVVPTAAGVVVGMESGLFSFDASGGTFTLILPLLDRGARFNDAAIDATGRLWAVTCDIENKQPLGRLLRIDPDLKVETVAAGLMTPNGLAVDSERGRLYLSDSHPSVRRLWWLPVDVAGGALGDMRDLADFRDLPGRPDGGAIDAEGTYWIAGVDDGVLHGFSRAGVRVAEVATPMASPTKIAFGGARLETVFLTSKTDDHDSGGHLCRATPGLKGRSETVFGYTSA